MTRILKQIWVPLLFLASTVVAQSMDTTFNKVPITYRQYLTAVGKNNLNYAAQKLNVALSQAGIELAKIFPDPEVGVGWFDNGMNRMGMGYGFNSSVTRLIELGGVRHARIDVAESEVKLTSFILQDYFRNLKAEATLTYLVALRNKFIFDMHTNSYKALRQMARVDSIRFQKGLITEMDWSQSKIEAGSMLNEAYSSMSDWKASLLELGLMISKQNGDSLFLPSGDFGKFDRQATLASLIVEAQNNRADLLAASQNRDVAKKAIQLAKANRVGHMEVNFRVGYASYDYNLVAPTPSFSQVSAGIAFPIRFSNKYAGELKMAHYASQQADLLYRQAEVQIQVEVTRNYNVYMLSRQRVQEFNKGLLDETRKVRDGKLYSYQRGASTILEVLNAQRTYNDLLEKYYETIYSYASALVELERSVGMWDIDF